MRSRARLPPQSVAAAANVLICEAVCLAADLRHVLLLLLVVGVPHHLVDAQVGVGAIAEGDGGRHARHLLHHDAVLEVAQARSAVLHWQRGREVHVRDEVAQTTRA